MSLNLSSIDYLKENDVAYSIKEYDYAIDLPLALTNMGSSIDEFVKTIAVETDEGELILCLVKYNQKLNLNNLKEVLDVKEVVLATEDVVSNKLSARLESLSPIGHSTKVRVIADKSLQSLKKIYIYSGQKGILINLDQDELTDLVAAIYAEIGITDYTCVDWKSIRIDEKYSPRIQSASDLKPFVYLKDVKDQVGQEVTYSGWLYNKRSSGKIMFLMFRDGSGDIQGILEKKSVSEEIWEAASELTIESSLQVTGKVKKDDRSPFGYEMEITDIKIIQIAPDFPIGKKEHGPDFLLDNRHLWLRSRKQRAILKIRDEIFYALTTFLRNDGFTRIDTPIFQPVSCEDTSELFEVDYFGDKTYLTQSGQLYCEAAEYGLGKTYDFGPVFRAEKSKTRKHLVEFWMMDAELPFTDLVGLMDFEEQLAKYIISEVLKNCAFELQVLERDTTILNKYVNKPFVRMTHKDTIDLLNEKFDMGLTYLDDIGAPEEAKLAEIYDMPVFISDWPAEIKAFYMPKYKDATPDDPNFERVKALDLMAGEGFGEIMGGAEREFSYNKLLDILEEKNYPFKDYDWYMDLRKYGTIPHCGFGIGLERFVRWVTGIKHIRETIPFPRMLNRMYP